MTSPKSTKSRITLRSSLVPSQKMLARVCIAPRRLAFLLAQQQQAQGQQRRDEENERADVRGEVGKAETFGKGADADWQEIRHWEQAAHDPRHTCQRRHRN